MAEPVAPGGVVGILGGGQLGRMLAIAAARMGLRARVYDPDESAPAGHVAEHVRGAWDDWDRLAAFADGLSVATLEFENVPVATVEALASRVPVRPGADALAVAQDRLAEKRFLNANGAPTAPYAQVDDAASLDDALARLGAPAILKTRRLGYDGKGQARIADRAGAAAALAELRGAPAILEAVVPFERECSAVIARGLDGSLACFDIAENRHEGGILRESRVPAALSPEVADEAVLTAARVVDALGYVGVMGVELFALADGRLLVNEIAPRVHNTGHWTIDAGGVDQFEQHLRAICGWPLAAPERTADAVMENLLGDEALDWARLAAEPGARLHLYGKGEARPGRKMGHVTRVSRRS